MGTHGDEFHGRAGTSGIRSAFRVPGRFGTRRPATAREGLPQAAQADQAFFERQPPRTVAVRHDGVRLAVPGALGDLRALEGENPEFFDRRGMSLGQLEIQGVADTPLTCSLFAISNLSKVRGGAYLAVWYLTRHTIAPSFEVQSVNPDTLGRLLKRLGMRLIPATSNMAGATTEVCEAARKKCQRHHWRLRDAAAGI
ncbi:MAG: hypothetical protein E6G66_11370 [Actinobacteria bacterium]|nr:MAG: hypothetical protein E6G66_11370 [Actinomycetota bacterium]